MAKGDQALVASPHALDYDWRFDEPTITLLCELVHGRSVLALGTPSIARQIEAEGGEVTLVDRQPVQAVRNHLAADVPAFERCAGSFDVAIADPPWYPRDLISWAEAGARAVGPSGDILVTAWPPETRPGADADLATAIAELRGWADVTELPLALTYDTPLFEFMAGSVGKHELLSCSPRHGRLLRLNVRRPPQPLQPISHPPLWHRFFIDGYQLAVRLGSHAAERRLITRHPKAQGWVWPYVSARAPGREQIGLWSSHSEVAQISDSAGVISVLREAFRLPDAQAFEASLGEARELVAWKIPRPPYRKVFEWQHP